MTDSVVILYSDSKIQPDRNFLVEDITSYLSSVSKKQVNFFRYARHALTMSIKVDTGTNTAAALVTPFTATDNYDYCSIQNAEDVRPVYYFIINKA